MIVSFHLTPPRAPDLIAEIRSRAASSPDQSSMLMFMSGGKLLTKSSWAIRAILLPRCCDSLIAVTLENFGKGYACHYLSGPVSSGSTCRDKLSGMQLQPFHARSTTIGCMRKSGSAAEGGDRLLIGTGGSRSSPMRCSRGEVDPAIQDDC